MAKRIVQRPWGRRKGKGWIIQPDALLQALKAGEIAEFGDLHVGARQLSKLIALMRFPDQELLISSNGRLEVENIQRYMARKPTGVRTEFRQPRMRHSFRVDDGAWVEKRHTTMVVIKPRKFL